MYATYCAYTLSLNYRNKICFIIILVCVGLKNKY